jgi:hypothetical protein
VRVASRPLSRVAAFGPVVSRAFAVRSPSVDVAGCVVASVVDGRSPGVAVDVVVADVDVALFASVPGPTGVVPDDGGSVGEVDSPDCGGCALLSGVLDDEDGLALFDASVVVAGPPGVAGVCDVVEGDVDGDCCDVFVVDDRRLVYHHQPVAPNASTNTAAMANNARPEPRRVRATGTPVETTGCGAETTGCA